MPAYEALQPFFGDIHNHCALSYGHGSLDDALANAREQLDFVSVTGHAHWPDMPRPTPRLQPCIDFHLRGFQKLKEAWPAAIERLREVNEEGRFVVFPGFEVHFCATGDRNILYKELDGQPLYPTDLDDLNRQLRTLRDRGIDTIAQPHHVGYRTSTRGIDWNTFSPEFAPLVELISMHGCSEEDEGTRPFLHVMGPSDGRSTIQAGLAQGHVFGVTGGTDHHSGHPGSYGHGVTGCWATSCTREALWEAFYNRRTFALTGDRCALKFAIDDAPMGSVIAPSPSQRISVDITAGGAIDYVDVLKNNRLLRRYSTCDVPQPPAADTIHTKLYLELGWGPREAVVEWDVHFGIDQGSILSVEPRFRGRQVVSPLESRNGSAPCHTAAVRDKGERSVSFHAVSEGNPNNFTPNTQGMCLEVDAPRSATVFAKVNGNTWSWPLEELLSGARSQLLDGIESPALRMHRAPLPWEWQWRLELEDAGQSGDSYYVRMRQKNDQWAWSSPIFVR